MGILPCGLFLTNYRETRSYVRNFLNIFYEDMVIVMEGISFILPNNAKALGVLGHLIVVNRQVHSYQLKELNRYLSACNSNLEGTCLPAILDGREDALSFEESLHAYSAENITVQECLYYLLAILANVDDCFDEGENHIMEAVRRNSKITKDRCAELYSEAYKAALSLRSDNNMLFAKPYSEPEQQKTLWQRIVEWFRDLFYKLFHSKDAAKSVNASDEDCQQK